MLRKTRYGHTFFGHPTPVFRFRFRAVKDGEGGVGVLGASTDTIKNKVKGMLDFLGLHHFIGLAGVGRV